MSGYKDIDPIELHNMMAAEKILLVDVRRDDEVARGMIQGAQHIPLHLIPLKVDELIEDGRPVVFYCHAGMRSAQACAFMSSKGRGNLFSLRGGVLAWDKHGYPLVPKT
ncbi:MAG TPA: rhodanese-like domain-containing protein [Anaerolineae bacterium]|nr:rhodanese-like domain-containing protein [Anaerolineae bacterium]